ncbi:phosphatase PAP2 family protein [Pseudonocardia bannensis]|uniref:Phosphatase PAP2 family protein n=1 Tax=Pseudonocardia bannensis TaxID=630973 RepID=A0A848DCW5_9PSEU|nr:phosphatase PAP2 family protein [Pseudonocardia bannensis]NMH90423.1 phosphatase PAP2 family protein [Pseudonocardia bannensis]
MDDESSGVRAVVAAGLAATVVLAAAAGFLLYAGATGTGPGTADVPVLTEFLEVRSVDATTLAVTVTTIGSTAAMAVLSVLVGGWLWVRGRRLDAVFLVVAMAGASVVFRLLKLAFDRPRPPAVDRLVNETNESLPSGHATMSIVVIGALVALAWGRRRIATRVGLLVAATLWVGTVGATRLYLGVHWFSDVLAGWLVGAAWLAVCVTVWAWWRRRPAAARSATPRATNGTFGQQV